MEAFQSWLPTPSAAPAVDNADAASGTHYIAVQRRAKNGQYTPISASVRANLPVVITPEPTVAPLLDELQEDAILVSEDDTTWRRLTRPNTALTGAYTLTTYTTGTGTLLTAAELAGTRAGDYTGVAYATLLGVPQTKRFFLYNDTGSVRSGLVMSLLDPASGEEQSALNGYATINYLGKLAQSGNGAVTAGGENLVWMNGDQASNTMETVSLLVDEVGVFDLTFAVPSSADAASVIPYQLDVLDNQSFIRISDSPSWPAGTFIIDPLRGTSLPLVQLSGADIQLNRILTHIRAGAIAPNPTPLVEALADGSYVLSVSGTGQYQYRVGTVAKPANNTDLLAFTKTGASLTIDSYRAGLATNSYLNVVSATELTIGLAVNFVNNGGVLGVTPATTTGTAFQGVVSRARVNGYHLISTGGMVLLKATGAINPGDLLNATATPPETVRAASGGEPHSAMAITGASNDEWFIATMDV